MAWRFKIMQGPTTTAGQRSISLVQGTLLDVQIQVRMMRPMRIDFTVPSDDPAIATILGPFTQTLSGHSYDFPARPYAHPGGIVTAYQRVSDTSWVHRFTGNIVQVEDEGDPDHARSKFVCLDPWHRMADQPIANKLGSSPDYRFKETRSFVATDVAEIADTLIGEANQGYLNQALSLPTIADADVSYSMRNVGPVVQELAGAYDFEFDLTYFDTMTTSASTLARFNPVARLGTNKEAAINLGWGIAPFNVGHARRLQDASKLANFISVLGGPAVSGASQVTPEGRAWGREPNVPDHSPWLYGDRHVFESVPDVSDETYLDNLATGMWNLRKVPREIVSLLPAAGHVHEPRPWQDVVVGDTITVRAGSRLRGGFEGVQRIYGWDMTSGADGIDVTTALYVSPEDAI